MLASHPVRTSRFFAASLFACALAGCASSFTTSAGPIAMQGSTLHGTMHGGQQPVSGSSIYLFAAGTTGYFSASSSLLLAGRPGVTVDANGRGYVTTDANGGWSITGDYTCNPNDQLYLLALGGNPGLPGTVNNSGIAMMNALGSCSSISGGTSVIISELSTVAAAEALQQFMGDGFHVGSSATNAMGIQNAFVTATNLVGIAATAARATTPGGNGVVPQAMLHTLGNALASCVNTSGNNSVTCASLFASTPINGAPSTDTLLAALSIAQAPGYKPTTIFNLSSGNPPFGPALTVAPHDFGIGISYSIATVAQPWYLAIDGTSNVWVVNRASEKTPYTTKDSVVKLSAFGAVLSGANGYGYSNVLLPEGIAIDPDGSSAYVGFVNGVSKYDATGALVSGFPVYIGCCVEDFAVAPTQFGLYHTVYGSNSNSNTIDYISDLAFRGYNVYRSTGFTTPFGIALDFDGSVYTAGKGSSSILKMDSSNTVVSPAAGYTAIGLAAPTGLGLDNASRVWAANSGSGTTAGTVSVLTNAGALVGNYATGMGSTDNLVIDGAGSAWVPLCAADCGGTVPSSVAHVSATGTLLSPAGGYQNTAFVAPKAVAIDQSGNLWVTAKGDNFRGTAGLVTEMVGVAAPVSTPAVNQISGASDLIGVKP